MGEGGGNHVEEDSADPFFMRAEFHGETVTCPRQSFAKSLFLLAHLKRLL
jgi:hypothetical protein